MKDARGFAVPLPLIVGAVLIFIGMGVLGSVLYQNFLPDPSAAAAAEEASSELHDAWLADEAAAVGGSGQTLDDDPMTRPLGKGFAVLYIPRLGKDWQSVVVEGVQEDDLLGKVGHFKRSAEPGQVGNFALAAHRLTRGSLFRNLDEVKEGDPIIVETRTHWYVYRASKKKIITPQDVEVVEPVPFKPGKTPKQAVITLTTCHPWYSSTQRLAVFGELVETRLKSMGPPEGFTPPKRSK